MKISREHPHRLIVEGPDDMHTIINLLRHHGLDYDNPQGGMPYVFSADGVDPLLKSVAVAAKSYKRLGFVFDSDTDIAVRWQAIRDKLRFIGVDLPQTPPVDGTVIRGFLPDSKIGVWLMPNNSDPGMLETFLSELIPSGDSCWGFAGEAALRAMQEFGARCPQNQLLKSRLHTWLAWQEVPGLPFGSAITAKYLQSNTQSANAFVSWYRRVFME